MDPTITFLVAVAALAVVIAISLIRSVNSRDRELTGLRRDYEGARTERDEARREAREARKEMEALRDDLKGLRKDLKGAKQNAFRAREKAKNLSDQGATGWGPEQEIELRQAKDRAAAAEEKTGKVKRELAEAEQARHKASATRSKTTEEVGVGRPDAEAARLQDQIGRLKDDLGDELSRSRDRDRDLITARKLAVQHERAFQVVRGQLELARERLDALGESLPSVATTPTQGSEAEGSQDEPAAEASATS